MNSDDILLETEDAMDKAVEYMNHEFSSVRTGKASPALVENIEVLAYGTPMRMKQLALITTPEPRLLVIQPFDMSTMKDIDRGIRESKLGINPTIDGKLIRLRIPELSEERRRDLCKTVRTMAEEARVRIRSIRRDGMEGLKKLEKEGDITEDDLRTNEKEVQTLTDKAVKSIDVAVAAKEAEILKV
jgi:ribosome recycling factor